MGKIERFEDVDAWKEARALARAIYRISGTGEFARDFGLRDQIRRAAVSVMSNIAEGFERGGNREFIQFLFIAKGSAGEVRSQLYVAADLGYVDEGTLRDLKKLTETVSRLIAGFIKYLKSSPLQGEKKATQ
ncbi:MAG: four helix bundle protein [Armatimonadetes bacterium CG_4_10_14_0_8_um_filter_66_14]|nr:MAG: four helix bundle protein [Armatimonadetes bacterium CG_4_10_14_0_8_um_filter_66_14]